jgi:hypothetical protein
MSSKTSSVVSGSRNLEHLTFEERVQRGAENAVRCMGITGLLKSRGGEKDESIR